MAGVELAKIKLSMSRPLNGFDVDALLVHLVERGELAKPFDLADDELGDVVDLFFGVEATKAEANGGVSELFIQPHAAEHVARLEARAGASRAAGDGDVFNRHHQAFAFH